MYSETVLKHFKSHITEGDIGIEIEVEGINLPHENNYINSTIDNTWFITYDGSLRSRNINEYAWEYVLRRPLPLNKITSALKILQDEFIKCKSVMNNSVRTGVHVHINVQELTLKQLAVFITCYLSLEELLINFCSPSRKGNHFCLRASDAEYLLFKITNFFNLLDDKIINNDIRYSSINLLSLIKYGSLEFRALETPNNFSKIRKWADILYTIKENSKRYESPLEIIEGMSLNGFEHFTEGLLGKHYKTFNRNDLNTLITNGVRNAQIVAYSVDWDEIYKDKQ